MRRSLPLSSLRDSLLLGLWGIFILRTACAGQLSTFLHPTLQPFTTAAGATLVLMGLFLLREGALALRRTSCCDVHEHESHVAIAGSKAPSIRSLAGFFKTFLILAPLLTTFFAQTSHFTITTVLNRGVVDDLKRLPSANPPQASGATGSTADSDSAVLPVQIIDMLYAVQMPSYREEFEGKQIELVGQFVPLSTGNPKGDRFQVVRMFITCCAADAKPVGVTVRYPKDLHLPEMGWIRVRANPVFPLEGGRRTVRLEASDVQECPAPDEPFVY